MFGFLRRGRREAGCKASDSAADNPDLTNAARDHLARCYRTMNILDREIDERVWTDHYLLGFGQGSLATMIQCLGANLTTEQKGFVTLHAFKAVNPDRYAEICESLSDLFARGEPEFMRGMMHGSNVAILTLGRPGPDLLAEPEVQAALQAAPLVGGMMEGFGSTSSAPYVAAGASLMHEYLNRHRKAAGYQHR